MTNRRGNLTLGIILILVGGVFLAENFVPSVELFFSQIDTWPWFVISGGLIFLVAAGLSGVSGLAVPGSIISGIGFILLYQDATGDYESWAYAWTLIIGFVGVGTSIMHMLDGRMKRAFREGIRTIGTSLVLFLIFGSFFRYIFGQPAFFGAYWPVLLILLGLWMLVKPLLTGGRRQPPPIVDIEMEMDEPMETMES